MNKRFQAVTVYIMLAIAMASCAPPIANGGTQPSVPDEVATVVAMTMQAITPEAAATPTNVPDVSTSLLPRSLYFLGRDDQSLTQLYRMESDGRTKTQLTFEPVNVTDYDVSMADGSIAYVASNQLLLADADGSNRRVLIDGGTGPDLHGFYNPVFSPDGGTLAYAHTGLNLYSVSTGVSSLVIEDQLEEPQILNGVEQSLPIETYWPERYSPDGTKLLINLGYFEGSSLAIYDPVSNSLVRLTGAEDALICYTSCTYSDIEWSADSAGFYSANSQNDYSYDTGGLWKVDAVTGAVTTLIPLGLGDGTIELPDEPFLAPDGQLYYFFGAFSVDSGYFDAPLLELVRSAPDGVTGRTVLRSENFRLMQEALWAPDASFAIVATLPERSWDQGGGVLELYPTDGQKEPVWLAPFGQQMKWGP
jgi:WD40 repeat protein